MNKSNHCVDGVLAAFGLRPNEVLDHGLRVRVLNIGPDEAKALLTLNTDNRKIRHGRVKYYARVMKNGEWILTHQGIAFSKSGIGLDLQHRLHGVILSGVAIQLMVVEGLSPEAFAAIDQQERRSVADAIKEDKRLVEEAKFLLIVSGGHDANHPTIRDIDDAAYAIKEMSESLVALAPTRTAIYASVAVRVATIMQMIDKPSKAHQIAQTYRTLTLRKTEEFTPIMHALMRNVNSGQIETSSHNGRIDLFRRAFRVLDPDNANLSKIQINGTSIPESVRQQAKDIIGIE